MSSHKREAKASFSVQTVGFPLIDYDAAKPISKETIDGAISWAMSNLEWVHEGMDGKSERFNFMKTKPTRQMIIDEMFEHESKFFPNLDTLEESLEEVRASAMLGDGPYYMESGEDGNQQAFSSRETSSGSSKVVKPVVEKKTLTEQQELDLRKELEIRLTIWTKEKVKYEQHLKRLFGVIRGNQTKASKHIVEKHELWTRIDTSKDGILLWCLILRTHSMANVRQPHLSMSAAEEYYNSYKMTKDMTLLDHKNAYELRVRTLLGAKAPMPDSATQARHFIDKLDLTRYGRFVEAVHNRIYSFPTTVEDALNLAESKVIFKLSNTRNTEAAEVPNFTSFAVSASNKNGKKKKGKGGAPGTAKEGEKKDQSKGNPKSQPKKDVPKKPSSDKTEAAKEERTCFGCQKKGHLLKDCPMREKVIARYSKAKQTEEASAMTALEEDSEHSIFWSFSSMPILSEGDCSKEVQEPTKDDDGHEELGASIDAEFIEEYNKDTTCWDTPIELDDLLVQAETVESEKKDSHAVGIAAWTLSLWTFVWQLMEDIVYRLCFACGPITAKSLLLDTGSDIHLTPSDDTPGLRSVTTANPPYRVKGVGHGAVTLNKVGEFIDIGPMYVGKCPCTIISVGVATSNGAKLKWEEDMSKVTLTTRSGLELIFQRRRQVWICNDYSANEVGIAMPTEAEVMMKYNRHELKQAEQAAEYLKRMRYPGRGTARSIVTTGAIRNLPVTTKGLNTRFDIAGQELAAEKGGRKKHTPKLNPDIVNESIKSEPRSSVLYVDLFFLNNFAFLLGGFNVPFSERAVYLQQFLSKGKGVDSILAGITRFVGIMRSNKVECEAIECDMESAVAGAKAKIESELKVEVQQIGDNVAEIERGIGTVKMVCRKVKAGLPFNLYGILFVFLVAWAVSGINMWTSPNYIGKLSPKEALTGRKPDASKEMNASFGDYIRTDATNAAFANNLDNRAVEAIALTPLGNDRGEWYCLSLETFRVLTRCIRPGDIVPTPTRVIHLLNEKASKWSQELKFSTRRGIVADIKDDTDILQDVPAHRDERSGIVGIDPAPTIDNMNGAPAHVIPNEEVRGSNTGVQVNHTPEVTITPEALGQSSTTGLNESSEASDYGLQFASEPLNTSKDALPKVSAAESLDETHIDEVALPDTTIEVDQRQSAPAATKVESTSTRPRRENATTWQERGNWKLNDPTPKSKLPYNSTQRKQPVRGEVKRVTRSRGSLYVSSRKDNIGKAYSFHMSLMKGLRKHKNAGFEAMLKELMLVHETGTIEGIDYASLTQAQKGRAIRSLLFFKEKYKPDGTFDKLKARLVAGGHMQDRSVYSQSDTSAPTVATEAVMMIAAIAAKEQRHVITVDIGGAFLKGKFKNDASPVVMRLDKDLADTLCAVDKGYEAYVRPDGSLYVKLTRPLYGLIEAAKLWYDEISSTLMKLGFEKNAYDQCTYNRDYKGHQHTVIIHVDDLKSTCCDDGANQELICALRDKYKEINVEEGDIHSYLGMTFDYSTKGKVRITQDGYVSELVASEDIKSAVKTPASEDLFVIDETSPELNKDAKEHFHSLTAKLLYLSKRTRPDILVAVSFLTSRVLVATEQDGIKLTRVLRYLYGTQDLGVTLEADNQVYKLYGFIDASYGVHADAKSHTGAVVTMGKGPILAKSVKQKINTKSSTEAELVGLSDGLSLVIWARNFLESQGYKMPPAAVFQDNMSTIAMLKNGRPTSDRTRHVNIRFFFARDKETSGEINIEYKPTKEMLADILTKPLQGELFVQLRNELLNCTA